MKFLHFLGAFALLAGAPAPLLAQTSLADIMSQLDARTSELEQVDALLADADANRRLAAMELLIKSGNPAFIQRATEVGIFSSDEELKRAALRAVFDGGGPFRILINYAGSSENQEGIKNWISGQNGSWDDTTKTATLLFGTRAFNEQKQCWEFADDSRCAFKMVGPTISIDGWYYSNGTFALNESGQLIGSFRVAHAKYTPVPAIIPIVE